MLPSKEVLYTYSKQLTNLEIIIYDFLESLQFEAAMLQLHTFHMVGHSRYEHEQEE